MSEKKGLAGSSAKSSKLDVNGDGKVNYKDVVSAARKVSGKLTPSKSMFDANGDGVIDHKDLLTAAKITGAAVVGAGATLAAGAYGGALIVSGTATAISTGIVSAAGATVGAFAGVVLGTATTTSFLALKTASGAVIIVSEYAAVVSPGLVAAFSAVGSSTSAMNSAVVAKIAGLPVVEAIAVSSGVSKGSLVVIAGVPVAREVAIAVGLLSVVIVGAYAYFLLNREVDREEVVDLAATPAPG